MAKQTTFPSDVDPRSGFCASNSTFYSKRKAVTLPSEPYLDATTFISTRRHSGTTALIDASTGRSVTFVQLWRSVSSVASALLSRFSVRKGQVVLILSPNSLHFPVVSLAVISIGAVLTAANPLNTPSEIAKLIAPSDPVIAFTTSALLPKLRLLTRVIPIILLDGEADAIDRHSIPADSVAIEEIIATEQADFPKIAADRVSQDDAAALLYSSGTTGESKGVVITHRNLISMVQILLNRFFFDAGASPGTFICTVPMFHVYGLVAFATGLLASGSTFVVLNRFDLGEMLSAVSRYGATYLPLVPPILVAMLNSGEKPPPLGRLKVLCGGAPLGKEVIEGFREKYPTVEILQAYGLTESTGIGASTDTSEESQRYGTAGLLSANTEARIVDTETGKPLPVNRPGELWIRGPYIMKGYFKNSEATESTLLADGWLRTGDVCYIDADGFLFVVGRLKELIKYNAYQVSPSELESLLLSHPDIIDAAVIQFPDEKVGQYPLAYVVRKLDGGSSSLSAQNVMDFVANQVAPYKKIRRVVFVSEIPKNASGKILRKQLIKIATSTLINKI